MLDEGTDEDNSGTEIFIGRFIEDEIRIGRGEFGED